MGKTKTLTEGTPWKQILLFSIPIFWGNIFQLLYSLVDTKIVGSTLGTEALAAVGSVSTLHTLMTGFLNGLTLGFSLITAMCFGADNMKRLKKSFAMTIGLGVLTTTVLVVALMFVLQPLLHLLNVPEEQFAMSYAYISVLIVGLFATVLYNLCANTLRAIGDSLTPLLFLILATVSNIGLDYLFILEFHMGVQGAAYATVLAQLISVVLCFVRIFRKFPILHLQKSDFRPEKGLIVEMYKSGLSMGLMSCLVSIGTIMLQSAINTFGTTVIVAHTAARKVFEIMSLPMSVLGSAMATYCGQNYGAKRDLHSFPTRRSSDLSFYYLSYGGRCADPVCGKYHGCGGNLLGKHVFESRYVLYYRVRCDRDFAKFHAGIWRPRDSGIFQLH